MKQKMETLEELSGKYWDLLKYPSVQTYLKNAIGARKNKISDKKTLKEKVKEKQIANYLRGVELFFEYSDRFNTPQDIMLRFSEIKSNKEALEEFRSHVDDYISWLSKRYTETTSITYQAHLRGYLKWNFIYITFPDYEADSEKKKIRDKLNIQQEKLVEIANRVPYYISKRTELEKYLVTNWLHISGLGSREILTLKFEDLRLKLPEDFNDKYIELKNRREKTNIKFHTFIYGEVLEDLRIYLKRNSDKKDDAFLFGTPKRAYDRLHYTFSQVINTIIKNHYPKWIEKHEERSLFTLHDYRHIFVTACRNAGIPDHIRKLFVAHKARDPYDEKSNLAEYFFRVQEHLFIDIYKNQI
jgi:hypothetical protein